MAENLVSGLVKPVTSVRALDSVCVTLRPAPTTYRLERHLTCGPPVNEQLVGLAVPPQQT